MKITRYRRDDQYFFDVQTDDGQLLSTSRAYADAAARDAAADQAETTGGNPYLGRDGDDNYRPLSFYRTNGTELSAGFDRFTAENEHYFTYNFSGVILLLSEGYTSVRARDNGIDSVTRNMTVAERYQRKTHPSGVHYFNLLAGNRQEIATSTWFQSGEEMENAIRIMLAGGRGGTVTTRVVAANRSASIAIAAAQVTGDEAPKPRKKRKKRTTPKPKAEKVYLASGSYLFNDLTYDIFRSGNGKHYFTFKNKEGKTILLNANVRGYDTQAEAQASVDRIMEVGAFERNFEGKTTKNGKYYYYLKDEDGKNLGKSFFFDSTEAMQASVGLFLGSEIATATFDEDKAGLAAVGVLAGGTLTGAPEPESTSTKETEPGGRKSGGRKSGGRKSGRLVDEYLDCAAYRGQDRSDTYPDFSAFSREGVHYFALLDEDGKVLLRSQAYSSPAGRDNGIRSVLANREMEQRWSTVEENGRHFAVLKAGNRQEIARSCPEKTPAAAGGYWKLAAAAAGAFGAAATSASAAAASVPEPAPIPEPTPTPEPTPVPVAPAPEPASAVPPATGVIPPTPAPPIAIGAPPPDTGGGFNWRWLLLLLPLLLFLLWWRGCSDDTVAATADTAGRETAVATDVPQNSEGDAAVAAAPGDEDGTENDAEASASAEERAPVTDAAPVDATPEVTAPPPPAVNRPEPPPAPRAAVPVTDCSSCDAQRKIFEFRGAARSVTKLGTLPEFGNSHGLTPTEFYEKLADRYRTDATDRAYLDYVFRGMGYGGFADAGAALFSETVIPSGTSGNLGFGTYHGYGHYTLNTSERDRQAFRLRAANGCDVHFMKTCGNYFFYCSR